MRSLFRSLGAVVFALLVMTAGSSAALASGDGAETGRYTIDDEWCFDDVVLQYCFDVDGFVRYTATPDGRELATMNVRNRTVVFENGVVVGSSDVRSIDTSVYEDGAQVRTQSVVKTRVSFGDQTCVSTLVFKMVDYEVIVDRWNGPDCAA